MTTLGPVRQGDAASWVITVRDASGSAITSTYTGSETLAARVWPGDTLPVSFVPTCAWKVAASGTIDLSVSGAQTTSVSPGTYYLQIRITDGGSTYSAFDAQLAIEAAPGATATPSTYCTYAELLTYGRFDLIEVPTDYDQAGFLVQRARARTWFEDLLYSHDRGISNSSQGWSIYSRIGTGIGKNPWLKTALAANQLLVTDDIKEANACYALSLILIGRPERAAEFRFRAGEIAKTVVAEIDTNADGLGDYTIDLSNVGR